MPRLTENKIVLITRQTRLEELAARYNTVDQARFYVESLGEDFGDYQLEHSVYRKAVRRLITELTELGRVQNVDRVYLPNFLFGPEDTVVVTGQDGLVANTLKYLNEQPVVAVNPDPDRWDGVLLPFKVNQAAQVVKRVFKKQVDYKKITMAMAQLPGGAKIYAVNDLFIGPKTHTSARYILKAGQNSETQSSSGIIVSTGLGSTGWLASILAGARGVARLSSALWPGRQETSEDGLTDQPDTESSQFDWSANYLFYSVREPFPSRTTGTKMSFGRVDMGNPLSVTSLMSSPGVIFSDGLEEDFWEFSSGQKAVIQVADKKGKLVM
ncbi:MAG: sugar kinase [Deltaproteobacteria bacterium]|jgi:NAD kinase|nr:sugar kinase [Deltaproteobacteria bacterium]